MREGIKVYMVFLGIIAYNQGMSGELMIQLGLIIHSTPRNTLIMQELRFRYQTLEFDDFDIHVRSLRDKQEFSDPLCEAENLGISSAQWSLFGVVWASSEILAREVQHYPIEGKRILEVGCGLGLASLVLNARHADVTATDIHPSASTFLNENVRLNRDSDIPFLRTDWKDKNDGLGTFDMIIGSDLLYEREHIDLLSEFLHQHTHVGSEILLVDPGRSNHAPFSKKMVKLGYQHSQHPSEYADDINLTFKGQVLHYRRNN
jgi:predicted nicotinamide N-methyase